MNIFIKAFDKTLKLWIIFVLVFLPPTLIMKGYTYSGGIIFLLEAFCATYYSIYLDLKNKE